MAVTLLRLMLDFFRQPLRQVRAEQLQFLSSRASRRTDWEVIAALVSAALLLTVQHYALYAADKGRILESLGLTPPGGGAARQSWRLLGLTYWAVGQTVVYVALPLALIKLVFRRPLADYGVKRRGALECWPAYVLMYLAILPGLLIICDRPSFQSTYPFYRLAPGEPLWPQLAVWEVLYAVQFFALEFFFRGFLLHALRRRFGVYAIFVMTVPYCMIHFGKPLLETLAAIVAGIALGFMSLKTRSIWQGAAVHVAVAWTMDAAALWQRLGPR